MLIGLVLAVVHYAHVSDTLRAPVRPDAPPAVARADSLVLDKSERRLMLFSHGTLVFTQSGQWRQCGRDHNTCVFGESGEWFLEQSPGRIRSIAMQ